jgi:hypothetical protein
MMRGVALKPPAHLKAQPTDLKRVGELEPPPAWGGASRSGSGNGLTSSEIRGFGGLQT